jgi:putative ATP-binding cassette transporter
LFKDIFYRQLLPELKRRGKTVLVITHDDRYFDAADRVLRLDYGQLMPTSAEMAFAKPSGPAVLAPTSATNGVPVLRPA